LISPLSDDYIEGANMLNDKQLVELIDRAIKDFQGNCDSLSGAIGYLMIGRDFG
jgi:hypothetical protein